MPIFYRNYRNGFCRTALITYQIPVTIRRCGFFFRSIFMCNNMIFYEIDFTPRRPIRITSIHVQRGIKPTAKNNELCLITSILYTSLFRMVRVLHKLNILRGIRGKLCCNRSPREKKTIYQQYNTLDVIKTRCTAISHLNLRRLLFHF